MRGALTFFIMISIATATLSQTKIDPVTSYDLTGKLTNKVTIPPPCGTISWATVLELEISDFNDQEYSKKTIAIILTCPEFYGDNFLKKGKQYRFKVQDQNPAEFEWAISNKQLLEKYQLKSNLWVTEVQRLKGR